MARRGRPLIDDSAILRCVAEKHLARPNEPIWSIIKSAAEANYSEKISELNVSLDSIVRRLYRKWCRQSGKILETIRQSRSNNQHQHAPVSIGFLIPSMAPHNLAAVHKSILPFLSAFKPLPGIFPVADAMRRIPSPWVNSELIKALPKFDRTVLKALQNNMAIFQYKNP